MVKLSALKKLATNAAKAGARLAVKKGLERAGGAEGLTNMAANALRPQIARAVTRLEGMKRGGVVLVRVPAKKKRAARRRRA